ncbi:MAG: DUF1858 domain-containing protein [Thermotogae bacterium]|nr:DUF1858 domain-containing protein [Thermotogota bacterium]
MIDAHTPIFEIVKKYPYLIEHFLRHGIKCIVCGDVLWGTLEEEARKQGITSGELQRIIEEANRMVVERGVEETSFLQP